MANKAVVNASDQTELLRYLLVLALYRGGLSQDEIRSRLGMSMNNLNAMLKGISFEREKTK
jgi:transposase